MLHTGDGLLHGGSQLGHSPSISASLGRFTEVSLIAVNALQDDRSGNGGGAAYDSDADYGGEPRRESDAASPAEPARSTQASRVRGRLCALS